MPINLFKKARKIKLGDRLYEVDVVLGQGGSGEVYKVRQAERVFALKVFFPFYQLQLFSTGSTEIARMVDDSLSLQKKEYSFLSRLDHPNIVRVYDSGEIALSASEQRLVPVKNIAALPAILTDYVDGLPLKAALEKNVLSADQFAHVLLRLARALEYLHAERHYMHADLKSANVLIRRSDSEPILIDFALCKNLNFQEVNPNETTHLLGDWDLFPKELPTEHRLKMIKESEGLRRELFELSFPFLDLFQFGKLLKALRPKYSDLLEAREIEYVDMLASELTDWQVVTKWGPRDLAPRLARLGPEHFSPFGVPELTSPTSTERTIMIPPGIGVPVTKRIEQLLDTRSFRRLALINQLCLLGYVYPGADYKRIVHVLHAYDLTRQLVTDLYTSSQFRGLFDRDSARQLLATVLLHDINHFPFLHIFQESAIPGIDRLQILDLFCSGDATGERAAKAPSIYELLADIGIEPDRFKRLVFAKHHEQSGRTAEIDQTINSIISSGVDVDKLSYLFLDSYFTGVRFGTGIDFPGLFKAATVGRLTRDRAIHLAFTDRAIQGLENVVMNRFWNFRSLYWHHTNRGIMAMILDVARKLYVELRRDVRDYVLDTMWKNDVEALRYLDDRYYMQLGQRSILSGMIEDRRLLFKRIYTVAAGVNDAIDDELYQELRKFDYAAEMKFRMNVVLGLKDMSGPGSSKAGISPDDVLLDVPRREMDSGGAVYVSTRSGELIALPDLSDPIRAINANYERLTKRVRLFVSPRVAKDLASKQRMEYRALLQKLLKQALDQTKAKSEVQ